MDVVKSNWLWDRGHRKIGDIEMEKWGETDRKKTDRFQKVKCWEVRGMMSGTGS